MHSYRQWGTKWDPDQINTYWEFVRQQDVLFEVSLVEDSAAGVTPFRVFEHSKLSQHMGFEARIARRHFEELDLIARNRRVYGLTQRPKNTPFVLRESVTVQPEVTERGFEPVGARAAGPLPAARPASTRKVGWRLRNGEEPRPGHHAVLYGDGATLEFKDGYFPTAEGFARWPVDPDPLRLTHKEHTAPSTNHTADHLGRELANPLPGVSADVTDHLDRDIRADDKDFLGRDLTGP